jgi:hypothetical protein
VTELDEILFDLCRKVGNSTAVAYDAGQLRAQAKSRIKRLMFKAAGPEPEQAAAYNRWKSLIGRIRRL